MQEVVLDEVFLVCVIVQVDCVIVMMGDVIEYLIEIDYVVGVEVMIFEMGSEIVGFCIVDLGEDLSCEEGGCMVCCFWYQL